MTSTDDPGNPFAAPESDEPGPEGDPSRPRARDWLIFAFRRFLLIVVIPLTLGVLALAWQLAPFWVAVVATWMVFVPTTAAVLVDRFLAPVTDPTPVVLATGLRMDRDRFRRLVRVSAFERLALAALLVAFGVFLLTTPVSLLSLFLFLFAAWTTWFTVQFVRTGDALIAFVERDPTEVLRCLEPVLRWPRLHPRMAEGARVQVANAHLMLGDPHTAIELLEQVAPNGMRQAHLVRAGLLAGLGEVDAARRAMKDRPPRNLGERLAFELATAAIALQEGHPSEVIEQARSWDALRAGQPSWVRSGLDLVEAGALVQIGRADQARALLARTGSSPDDRPWLAASWPQLWEALGALGAEPPSEE